MAATARAGVPELGEGEVLGGHAHRRWGWGHQGVSKKDAVTIHKGGDEM